MSPILRHAELLSDGFPRVSGDEPPTAGVYKFDNGVFPA